MMKPGLKRIGRRSLDDIFSSLKRLSQDCMSQEKRPVRVEDSVEVDAKRMDAYKLDVTEEGEMIFIVNPEYRKKISCPFCSFEQAYLPEGQKKNCYCFFFEQVCQRLNQAGIPNRYKGSQLEKKMPDQRKRHDLFKKINQFLVDFRQDDSKKTFLMFYGFYGSGKTFLACYLLKVLIIRYGLRGAYIDYGELMLQAYTSFSHRQEVVERLSAVDVLLVDDLGKESFTISEKVDILDLILTQRYNNRRLTLFTSNYHPDGFYRLNRLEKIKGEYDEQLGQRLGKRILSRLLEEMVLIDFSELSDLRKQFLHASLS